MAEGIDDQVSRKRFESDLADVTSVPLTVLLSSEDSVLVNALRRLRAEIAQPEEIVAGHSSKPQPIESRDRDRRRGRWQGGA
jgi:FXSXX-COOH protein